LKSETLW